MSDAPRWSSVFRWWVQAPPGGWPEVPPGLLDVHLEPQVGMVEELMRLSDKEFNAVFAYLSD